MRALARLGVPVLVMAGCAGSPSISEYGDHVQALGRAYEQETTDLQAAFAEELQREIDLMRRRVDEDDPMAVAAFAERAIDVTRVRTRTYMAAVGDALHRYHDELADVEAPQAVSAQHVELVAAIESALAGIPELLEGLAEADDFDAIDGAVHASGFSDSQPRLTAACLALEEAIVAAGRRVSLRCPG